MRTLLIVLLVLLLLGGGWGWHAGWGPGPFGGLAGLVLVVALVWFLVGRRPLDD